LTPLPGLVVGQQVAATRAEEFSSLVDDVAIALKSTTDTATEADRHLALDRLGQAIQTSISARHISGNPSKKIS
jgi:hypothetical protein